MEYKQLSGYERFRIAHLQAAGASQRQIAAALDRAPSTVARELKRNGTPAGRYAPDYAHLAARSRRWRGARLERDAALRDRVLAGFARRWSPQQIAERLARDAVAGCSATRASTGSSTGSKRGSRTTGGLAASPRARPNGAGGVGGAAAPPASSPTASLSISDRWRWLRGRPLATGRRT